MASRTPKKSTVIIIVAGFIPGGEQDFAYDVRNGNYISEIAKRLIKN